MAFSRKVSWAAVTLAVATLHLMHNGARIGDKELWLDEASTYGVAAQSLARNLTLPIEFHSQPPLYYVILHGLIRLGSSEWFMRSFSWLMCLGFVLWVLLEVRELQPLGRLVTALYFVFATHTHYLAQELRPYALGTLTSFVSTICFLRLIQSPSRAAVRNYLIWTCLALYSLAFDAWVVAAHALYVVVSLAMRRADKRVVLTVAAAMLLYVPYLVLALYWQGDLGEPSARGSLHAILLGNHYLAAWQTFAPAELMLGLLVLALILLGLGRNAPFWGVLILGQVIFVYAFLHGRREVQPRYLSTAFGPFCFLIGAGIDRVIPSVSPAVERTILAVLGLAVCVQWRPFRRYLKEPRPIGPWHQLLAEAEQHPGRKVFFFDPGYEGQMLEYVARADHDIVFATNKGRRWSSGGDMMFPEYISSQVAATVATTSCYFYHGATTTPSYNTFVEQMGRAEFTPVRIMSTDTQVFCRP